MKTYNFSIDESGKFLRSNEVFLSQNEYGGVTFAFSLPAAWADADVTVEYYIKTTPSNRVRTLPLSSEGSKFFYEVGADFTAVVGTIILQLVGEKDGKVMKTLVKGCPRVTVIPSVNALLIEADSPYSGLTTSAILALLLARIDEIEERFPAEEPTDKPPEETSQKMARIAAYAAIAADYDAGGSISNRFNNLEKQINEIKKKLN